MGRGDHGSVNTPAFTQAMMYAVVGVTMIVAGLGKRRLEWRPRDKSARRKWWRRGGSHPST
jgi:hypothetical protein